MVAKSVDEIAHLHQRSYLARNWSAATFGVSVISGVGSAVCHFTPEFMGGPNLTAGAIWNVIGGTSLALTFFLLGRSRRAEKAIGRVHLCTSEYAPRGHN